MPRSKLLVAGSCQSEKKIITHPILIQSLKIISRFDTEIHTKKMPYELYSENILGGAMTSQNAEKRWKMHIFSVPPKISDQNNTQTIILLEKYVLETYRLLFGGL